jgi:hypothetical protein
MAARKHLTQLPRTREKIRASILINRLMNHVLGKCDMTPSQARAARLVRRKNLNGLQCSKVLGASYGRALATIEQLSMQETL